MYPEDTEAEQVRLQDYVMVHLRKTGTEVNPSFFRPLDESSYLAQTMVLTIDHTVQLGTFVACNYPSFFPHCHLYTV